MASNRTGLLCASSAGRRWASRRCSQLLSPPSPVGTRSCASLCVLVFSCLAFAFALCHGRRKRKGQWPGRCLMNYVFTFHQADNRWMQNHWMSSQIRCSPCVRVSIPASSHSGETCAAKSIGPLWVGHDWFSVWCIILKKLYLLRRLNSLQLAQLCLQGFKWGIFGRFERKQRIQVVTFYIAWWPMVACTHKPGYLTNLATFSSLTYLRTLNMKRSWLDWIVLTRLP